MALEYLTVEHLNTKDLIRIFSNIEIHSNVSFVVLLQLGAARCFAFIQHLFVSR